MAPATTTIVFYALACMHVNANRIKTNLSFKSQKGNKSLEPKGNKGAQSPECKKKVLELVEVIGDRITSFTSSCGIAQSEIVREGDGFAITLDGKSRLCHPTCQGIVGLGDALPDIDALRNECRDSASQREIVASEVLMSMAKVFIQGWQSCGTTALRQDLDCDCNFEWNNFQHAYACMVATGKTKPAERSAMYHRYKRECGCVKIDSNSDGIDLDNVKEGAGASDIAVSEELAQLRQFLLLKHINEVVMNPSCEGAKKLFARFDVTGNGEVDSDFVIATFAKYKTYQAKELKGDALEAVKELTDTIFSQLERCSMGPKLPMSESSIVSFFLGDGVTC